MVVEEMVVETVEEETVEFAEEMSVEMSDESVEAATKTPVICDECQDLTVFNEISDMGLSNTWCCQKCNLQSLILSQTTEGSVASSHSNRSRPPVTFKSLYGEKYAQLVRQKGSTYIGNRSSNGVQFQTKSFGSGQAAQLVLLCVFLAMESDINPDDTVNWKWKGDVDVLLMPFNQWKFELREDVRLLEIIGDDAARRHLRRVDICGDDGNVVVTALKAIAKHMKEDFPANKMKRWKIKPKILEKIAEELVGIAEKVEADEDAEFPWVVDGSRSYPFPEAEKWKKEKKKLERNIDDGKLKRSEPDICGRLESVIAHWACEVNVHGHRSPPSKITQAYMCCPRQLMAEYSLTALFEGLLCDPVCGNKNFYEYIPENFKGNPLQMSTKERKKALLAFLREIKAIPEWYTPFCLQDWDKDNFNLNATREEKEKMKEVFKDWIGGAENLDRLRKERQRMEDMEEHHKTGSLRAEHIRRCEQDGKRLLSLIDNYCNNSTTTVIPFAEFKDKFTCTLNQIEGLEYLSADDFPSLKSADESVWKNERNSDQRRTLLGKLLREVVTALYPPKINGIDLERKPGDCTHPNCSRNCFHMGGSSFQGAHIDDTKKTNEPSWLAQGGSEKFIEEMKIAGICPTCAMHHDGLEEKRDFDLDGSKHHLLSQPRHALGRDDGSDFLQILRHNRVRRLQYCLYAIDCYGRGLMKDRRTESEICDYNTLRVMFLAYFDTVADDVMLPSVNEWNENGCRTAYHILSGLKYVVQNHCGVCLAANQPGTLEAKNKPQEIWENGDYACDEMNYDFREYTAVERQRIEGDHTYSRQVTGRKKVSQCLNIFELLDEICHAPFHCYFCHKRRSANQDPRKPDRDYTIG
eukprot:scaffold16142_cov87-Skeletonema_dohrnii-CCMP3373.AAC.2